MEFVIADKNRKDVAYLIDYTSLDIDCGDTNDFELKISTKDRVRYGIDFGYWIYSEGTEFGGRIERKTSTTTDDEETWQGITFRGLLEKDIVIPQGDYRIVSGEANTIINTILTENNSAGSIFTVPDTSTVAFTNYQFDRYKNKLRSLNKMLGTKNYKLKIQANRGDIGGSFLISAEAVPIVDYSSEIEYSQDSRTVLTVTDDRMGINHLICLGQGELSARQRIDLYVDSNGNITKTKYFSGVNERIEVYDYSSVEGETATEQRKNLEIAGIEKLKELANQSTIDIDVIDTDMDIGDIVGGRDRDSGLAIQQPIKSKILRVSDNEIQVELKVQEEVEESEDIE